MLRLHVTQRGHLFLTTVVPYPNPGFWNCPTGSWLEFFAFTIHFLWFYDHWSEHKCHSLRNISLIIQCILSACSVATILLPRFSYRNYSCFPCNIYNYIKVSCLFICYMYTVVRVKPLEHRSCLLLCYNLSSTRTFHGRLRSLANASVK